MPEPQSRTLRQRALLWWNRARFDVCVRWRGSWPELVLHERFRGMIRAAKTVLTAIGLLAAFLTFESVWISFLFGAVVWGCTTLVEKVAFSYNSMFVHSLPDFDLQPDLWLGAFFGYAQQPGNPHQIPMVGWIMGRADYARKVHTLLLRWAYGNLNDEYNNVRASVIVLSDTEYIFFCHPHVTRESAQRFFAEVEEERRQTSLTDVHHRQVGLLVFGKRCQITAGSYFPTFQQRYQDGVPYIFRLVVAGADGTPTEIAGLPDLILHNLKIKDHAALDRKEIEYDLIRILGT